MNEELYTLFNELPIETQKSLDFIFKDAPKMLELLLFLREQKEPFKSPRVIRAIYKEELDETDFKTLTNRYHKLRQTLIAWLYHFLKKTGNFSSKEEQELEFLRFLVSKNQFHAALEQALVLESRCWELDLFELLPNLLHLIIFCRQSLTYDTALVQTDEIKLESAAELHYKLQKLQNLFQLSYTCMDVEHYQNILQSIRRVTDSAKDIPRFHLIYHYVAFARGCFIPAILKTASNALTRHLNKIETIKAEKPDTPFVFISLPRAKAMQAKLLVMKAIFHFLKARFSDAALALRDLQNLKKNNPGIEFPESEAELRNSISILIGNQQFEWAWEKIAELEEFYEKNKNPRKEAVILHERSNIFFFQFPNIDKNLLKKHYSALLQFDATKPDAHLLQISLQWIGLLLGHFLEKEALQSLKAYYARLGNTMDIDILETLSKGIHKKDKKVVQACIKSMYQQLKQTNNSIEVLYLKQLIQIAKFQLNSL